MCLFQSEILLWLETTPGHFVDQSSPRWRRRRLWQELQWHHRWTEWAPRLDLLHLRRRRFPNGWQPGSSYCCHWLCFQPLELLCRKRWFHSWPPELFFHAVGLLKCFGLKYCAVNIQVGPLNCSVTNYRAVGPLNCSVLHSCAVKPPDEPSELFLEFQCLLWTFCFGQLHWGVKLDCRLKMVWGDWKLD